MFQILIWITSLCYVSSLQELHHMTSGNDDREFLLYISENTLAKIRHN